MYVSFFQCGTCLDGVDTLFADPLCPVIIVIGAAVLFLITVTAYRFYVRRENRLLDGTPEEVARVMKRGVTQEQVDMGWRYEGYWWKSKIFGYKEEIAWGDSLLFLSTVHTVQLFAGLVRVMFSRLSVQGDGHGARENTRYFYIVNCQLDMQTGLYRNLPKVRGRLQS